MNKLIFRVMTASLFEDWFALLMPLAKEEARMRDRERVVIVMDNASYHGRYKEDVSLKQGSMRFLSPTDAPPRR